jgi:5'-3' exonuclease
MSDDDYETVLINMVCERITEYVKMIRPESKVFIAFDGVAPVAKLNQQRERRYKSWFTTIVEQTIHRKAAAAMMGGTGTEASTAKGVQAALQKAWNTSSITPGTRFMTKLNTRMREYVAAQAYAANDGSGPTYIYSGSDTAGEGEHKIFEYIREFPGYHKDTTTLIYGLDADLIMLCLNHLHISENIFLYRDTPEFIQSLDNTLSKDDHYFLDIPTFACSLEAIMRETKTAGSTTPATGSTSTNTTPATGSTSTAGVAVPVVPEHRITEGVVAAIDDYILMTFMLGNDFMPHFPSLNLRTIGMTILLQTYADVFRDSNQYLVRRTKNHVKEIVWKSMRALIERLATNEHELLMNEHKTRDKQSRRFGGGDRGGGGYGDRSRGGNVFSTTANATATATATTKVDMSELTGIACDRVLQMVSSLDKCHSMLDFMSIPLQERAAEKYIDPFRENWEYRYYDALFEIDSHARGVGGVDRVRMICVNYIEGLEWTMRYYSTGCVDWRWTYKYPYAPLLKDLVRFIPHMDTAMFKEGVPPNPVRDLVQLCYVLPMSGHGLLPPAVAEKLKREYSHYYCDKLEFKWSYFKYFWEAHTELPHIRISDLEDVVGGFRPPATGGV